MVKMQLKEKFQFNNAITCSEYYESAFIPVPTTLSIEAAHPPLISE
jgi:hypothetical protein